MTQPDPQQAIRFFRTLYAHSSGVVHMRCVPEPKDGRIPRNHHYALDQHFETKVADFLNYCCADHRAAFFLPGTVRAGGTGKADVLFLPAVLADFDKGNPSDSLAAAEAVIGKADMVVESGGETKEGQAKLHAYWLVDPPATGAQIDEVCRAREAIALRFGGDPAFKQAAQVVRIPGSIHYKSEPPKLVRLR